eukprot:COSAG06_NODE_3864_length_4819_cov_48.933686_1_plen_105_part_00
MYQLESPASWFVSRVPTFVFCRGAQEKLRAEQATTAKLSEELAVANVGHCPAPAASRSLACRPSVHPALSALHVCAQKTLTRRGDAAAAAAEPSAITAASCAPA